jgi:hypothetical protein
VTLSLGLDSRDAGQAIVKAAATSDAAYYFRISLPNGDRYYFPALVMGFRIGVGSADSLVAGSLALEIIDPGSLDDVGYLHPPLGYLWVTTNDGNTFLLTNGGAERVLAKVA